MERMNATHLFDDVPVPTTRKGTKSTRRCWKVIVDPTGEVFLGGLFRTQDLVRGGGFEVGTVFLNIDTGVRREILNGAYQHD